MSRSGYYEADDIDPEIIDRARRWGESSAVAPSPRFGLFQHATYSPEDNKLRLYPDGRLDPEELARVKDAGFRWAPKQQLFVAPAWTPEREDLLIGLCGTIDDEDTSLMDRQSDRAERFETYSDKRANDAESARRAVSAIADNIPFGQPILVGHHSQRHAERDARRIENGMRKAVQMWRTSEYWTQRAASAIRHAKYKERPDVRARRIKRIEADKRKAERTRKQSELVLRAWSDLQSGKMTDKATGKAVDARRGALFITNHLCGVSACFPLDKYPREDDTYEGARSLWSALDRGIIDADQARAISEPTHHRTIERQSRWVEHCDNRLAYERAMLGEAGGTIADQTRPEKGGGVRCWASPRGNGAITAYSFVQRVNKVTVSILDTWGNGGKPFRRTIPFDKLTAVLSVSELDKLRAAGRILDTDDGVGFLVVPDEPEAIEAARKQQARQEATEARRKADTTAAEPFQQMADTLRSGGVQVVSAPQLFPTPPQLARRMIELANIRPGMRVLEPSAGTGRLLDALPDGCQVVAVEINRQLAESLGRAHGDVRCVDFLDCSDLGLCDAIVMNPPFAGASDVRHILHARQFLAPGAILVAICANGSRQQRKLKPLASTWEELPAEGTNVRTVLLTIHA